MIYKFKSAATGDLIMLGPNGDQMLRLLGREPAARGIIEVAAMPMAAAALREAIARAEQPVEGDEAAAEADGPEGPRSVGLRQRLWPMVQMLERAHAERADIVWGV